MSANPILVPVLILTSKNCALFSKTNPLNGFAAAQPCLGSQVDLEIVSFAKPMIPTAPGDLQ
jgi:hypothetical protein